MYKTVFLSLIGAVLVALAGCQATSTAGAYSPDNCGMVGSRCSRH